MHMGKRASASNRFYGIPVSPYSKPSEFYMTDKFTSLITAPNGAWNVTMREEGVTVDRADPANWVISAPAANVVAGRDFSVQDFMQALAARAQVARAECSDSTLTTQAPIKSEEAADSTTDLSVNVDGVKISAMGAGIHQVHHGEGDITVNVRSSCIETSESSVFASSNSSINPATNEGTSED